MNNPLNVLASNYNSFVNRLKYSDFVFKNGMLNKNTTEYNNALLKSEIKLTSVEIECLTKNNEFKKSPEFIQLMNNMKNYYWKFFRKYRSIISKTNAKNPYTPTDSLEIALLKSGATLSDSDKFVLKFFKEYEKTDTYKAYIKFDKEYSGTYSKILEKYREVLVVENSRNTLNKLFALKPGILSDLFASQEICRPIVQEYKALSKGKIDTLKQLFVTPFIGAQLEKYNNATIAKIEDNKKQTNYTNNETPKTEADKLFDKLMEKYKGKVVYVDFWATWCGPCRSGIMQIKPLKEELANENIAFVYITGETSPLDAYNNFIPTVKGEHYRLSNDEWNYICSKFNISGIPHYVLVGKKGEIINPNLSHMDNNGLKEVLLKEVAKE